MESGILKCGGTKTESEYYRMIDYKELLILRLSHLTEWKNETEMIIPEEMCGDFLRDNTCEFLGDRKYIIRSYYENGRPARKAEYQNGLRHGLSIGWRENGDKYWEREYQNDQRYRKYIGWHTNGNKYWEDEYQNDQLHGRSVDWDKNGNKISEMEYQNGKYIRNIK